jgi:hypothetical protein
MLLSACGRARGGLILLALAALTVVAGLPATAQAAPHTVKACHLGSSANSGIRDGWSSTAGLHDRASAGCPDRGRRLAIDPTDLSQLPGSRVAPERCVRAAGLPIALAGARATQIVIRGGNAVTDQSPLRLSLSRTSGVRSVRWAIGGLSAGSSRTAPFTVTVKPRQLKTTRENRLTIRTIVRQAGGRTLRVARQVRVAACSRLSSRRIARGRAIQRIDSRTALRAVRFHVPTWTLSAPRRNWRQFGRLRFLTADRGWRAVRLILDGTGRRLTRPGVRPRVVVDRDRIDVDRLPPRVGAVELFYISPTGQRFHRRR